MGNESGFQVVYYPENDENDWTMRIPFEDDYSKYYFEAIPVVSLIPEMTISLTDASADNSSTNPYIIQ